MPFIFYFLLINLPVILGIAFVLLVFYKKETPVQLYSEGLRNENNGFYDMALSNYEKALIETRKLNINRKFNEKIAQRIKILRSIVDFEKNFQDRSRDENTDKARNFPSVI
jgi:hypothetical protein